MLHCTFDCPQLPSPAPLFRLELPAEVGEGREVGPGGSAVPDARTTALAVAGVVLATLRLGRTHQALRPLQKGPPLALRGRWRLPDEERGGGLLAVRGLRHLGRGIDVFGWTAAGLASVLPGGDLTLPEGRCRRLAQLRRRFARFGVDLDDSIARARQQQVRTATIPLPARLREACERACAQSGGRSAIRGLVRAALHRPVALTLAFGQPLPDRGQVEVAAGEGPPAYLHVFDRDNVRPIEEALAGAADDARPFVATLLLQPAQIVPFPDGPGRGHRWRLELCFPEDTAPADTALDEVEAAFARLLGRLAGRAGAPRPGREGGRRGAREVVMHPFPTAFAPARIDAQVAAVLPRLGLFRRTTWSAVPDREMVLGRRLQEVRDTFGEKEAVRQGLLEFGDKGVRLTARERGEALRRQGLGAGYREVRKDGEYLVRYRDAGPGVIEAALSWKGHVAPFMRDWWRQGQKTADRARSAAEKARSAPSLFRELDDDAREAADRAAAALTGLQALDRLAGALLAGLAVDKVNPVTIPAESLRVLLGVENDEDWKDTVFGSLTALRGITYRLKVQGGSESSDGLVGRISYKPAGPGRHRDGFFEVFLNRPALGVLALFATPAGRKGEDFTSEVFDWGTKLEGKQDLRKRRYASVYSGNPFVAAELRLPPAQLALLGFIDAELTRRGSAAAGLNGCQRDQVPRGHADAQQPRRYDRTFCPLLPEGQHFFGVLGNFTRHPEAGRTLGGTPQPGTNTGGGRAGGILHELGIDLPRGRAVAERRRIAEGALRDFREVVVERLGGVVAARPPGRGGEAGAWLSLGEAARLEPELLLHQVKFFPFVPPDHVARRDRLWEESRRRKAEEGKARYAYRVCHTREEALASAHALASGNLLRYAPAGAGTGGGSEGTLEGPLYHRLRQAREGRGLNQADLAELFGVSRPTVAYWENDTRPVSRALVRLVERWVATGEAPTPEELAVIRQRRSERRRAGGKPRRVEVRAGGRNIGPAVPGGG